MRILCGSLDLPETVESELNFGRVASNAFRNNCGGGGKDDKFAILVLKMV